MKYLTEIILIEFHSFIIQKSSLYVEREGESEYRYKKKFRITWEKKKKILQNICYCYLITG